MSANPMLLTGNHAVAWAARLARPQVVPVYPITPQTPVLEKLTDFQAEGCFDAEIITPKSARSERVSMATAGVGTGPKRNTSIPVERNPAVMACSSI